MFFIIICRYDASIMYGKTPYRKKVFCTRSEKVQCHGRLSMPVVVVSESCTTCL